MSARYSRRDALRIGTLSGLSLFHAPLLWGWGCASDAKSLPPGDAGAVRSWKYDPKSPWWMQFNYGPVDSERTETSLVIEGAIPPELDGLYLRNGSNPKHGDPGHWFLGNGMVHGVRLEG